MSLLFETIQLHNRKLHNLAYHNARMQRSRSDLLGINDEVNLAELIQIPEWVDEGLYRCRVSYKNEVEKTEFFPYVFKHPARIELIEDTGLVYPYKFEDRSCFQDILAAYPQADDAVVLHDGYLTDATFANMALFDGRNWLTPATPLLKGTKRQALLDAGILREALINVDDLQSFRQLSLINAMRDLNIVYDFTFHHNHLLIHGTH